MIDLFLSSSLLVSFEMEELLKTSSKIDFDVLDSAYQAFLMDNYY
jgi:hypothetical protein